MVKAGKTGVRIPPTPQLNKKGYKMKKDYKELYSQELQKNTQLKSENLKLTIALCNLRDEYLDMGGDPKQLELFDEDNPSQLNIFESPDGGETVYKRKFNDYSTREKV